MHISDFDYELPPERIAREPARPRDASRMLVLHRQTGDFVDAAFRQLPEFLKPSDVLVVNDTRVLRARVYGKLQKQDGTSRNMEVLFAGPVTGTVWEVMCRPGRRLRVGERFVSNNGEFEGTFREVRPDGLHLLESTSARPVLDILETAGHIPLPPYIVRDDTATDAIEYQTVYAERPGAVAAPTAGLHFTEGMFQALERRGVEVLKITLHVGVGTFIPVRDENPEKHVLKPERFEVNERTAERLNAARDEGRRIIAVGTTTTRTLEYLIKDFGRFRSGAGETNLFILPGYEFRAINGILTNFHLPKSTLLMLVSAFVSREKILDAYRHAVNEQYRFYSYGDCMLIL